MSEATPWGALHEARAELAPHVRVHRRTVRGERWAVLHNALNGAQVRLNEAALEVVLALDGERSVSAVLAEVRPEADSALQEALARTLLTLEAAGLLRLGRVDDTARLVERSRVSARRRRIDPLAWRLPLHDPDAWLSRLTPPLARLIGPSSRALFVLLIALALAVAFGAGERLSGEVVDAASTPHRWWIYVLLWPPLKLLHELAHAVTVKHHGGSVHEAGITLLVLMPVPYVDASDSAGFERRAARIGVAAAGMLAEATVAVLALLLWSVTEPGIVHEAALAAALLGSVSTLLFNANPLLRFDGYQILQELLDVPNLGTRSSGYLTWLVRRHVLRAVVPRPPLTGPRERRWLLGYGLASLLYRWVLTFAIALYLATSVPLLGIPLALFALHRFIVLPSARAVRYLAGSAELEGRRAAASLLGGLLVAVPLTAFALVPLPSSTRVEGVVRAPPETALVAAADGVVTEAPVRPGASVRSRQTVLVLVSPELDARRARLRAEVAVLETRRGALLGRDPGEAARLDARLEAVRGELLVLDTDRAALVVRASSAGRFAPVDTRFAPGRAVYRGEVLGHVTDERTANVAAVVDQRAIGRVRDGVRTIRVRPAERVGEVVEARLVVEVPSADRHLPSAALAFDGSRGIAVASAEGELRTVEPVFHLELELPPDTALSGLGGRAYVTLVHDAESLGRRLWRAMRQLFLEKLSL